MSEILPSNENLIETKSLSNTPKGPIDQERGANLLNGKDWLKNSLSNINS